MDHTHCPNCGHDLRPKRRKTIGQYTIVEGKLGAGDSRNAYAEDQNGTPWASFWTFEEGLRWARERQS